jgi:putative tryptophan/tyrosine transport system substrate-binding protein
MDIKNILRIFYLYVFLFLSVNTVSANEEIIAVVYPELRPPYDRIFKNILSGIRSNSNNIVKPYLIKKNHDFEELKLWIKEESITSLIALGTRAQNLTSTLPIKNKILGAVLNPPKEGVFKSSILLPVDPGILFKNIKALDPNIETIYLIYSRKNTAWYKEAAIKASARYKLKIIPIEASSKKESLMHYKKLFTNELDRKSAVWIIQDSSIYDRSLILPYLLKMAWKNRIPIISNYSSDVEKGVLFSLYPNYFDLGQKLVDKLNVNNGEIYPNTQVFTAANHRTAAHLELNWSYETKEQIHLLFPAL